MTPEIFSGIIWKIGKFENGIIYILVGIEEIEKRVNETISSIGMPADIKADLDKIDKSVNDDELKEIIKNRYTSRE